MRSYHNDAAKRAEMAEGLRYLALYGDVRYAEQLRDCLYDEIIGYQEPWDYAALLDAIADQIDPVAEVEYGGPCEPDHPRCGKCGCMVDDGDAFCSTCGSRLEWRVKEEAGWKCEVCGKQCRRPGEPFDTHRRTLTVAHLDHTPENCARENLKAMCAPCHLRYDARQHAETRRMHKNGND